MIRIWERENDLNKWNGANLIIIKMFDYAFILI